MDSLFSWNASTRLCTVCTVNAGRLTCATQSGPRWGCVCVCTRRGSTLRPSGVQFFQAHLRVRQVRGGSSFMEFSSRYSGMASWLLVVECGKQWPARSMSRQLPTLDGRLPRSCYPSPCVSAPKFYTIPGSRQPTPLSHSLSIFCLPHPHTTAAIHSCSSCNPEAAYSSSLFTMTMRYPHYPN